MVLNKQKNQSSGKMQIATNITKKAFFSEFVHLQIVKKVFTGLFDLLAFFPRRYAGIWELVIFHKAAVSATVPLLIDKITPDIQSVYLTDGILAIILFISYLLTKGYTAWKLTG